MSNPSSTPVKVLLVDDSAVVRKAVTELLSADPAIELVGTAIDPYVARDKLKILKPDVLILDLSLPRMDGMTFLGFVMKNCPMPVIILSALVVPGSTCALEALKVGAFDVVHKPSGELSLAGVGRELIARIKQAGKHARQGKFSDSAASVSSLSFAPTSRRNASEAGSGLISTARSSPSQGGYAGGPISMPPSGCNPRQLLLFGASTGGTEALKSILTRLPAGLPGIAIVQHIPSGFSRSFAERLNSLCEFEVREAVHGDLLTPGIALVAPGGHHMELEWAGSGYRVSLNQREQVHHQRPAVDVLFRSAAACAGANSLAVLLTGMGRDGADGMKALKDVGAQNLAQDRQSCVVFGMPQAAEELGVVDAMVPLDLMPQAILRRLAKASVSPGAHALAVT